MILIAACRLYTYHYSVPRIFLRLPY